MCSRCHRERKQLKDWRREKNVALIESLNPEWDDIAEGWYTGERDSSLRSE
jgi:predicted GIY-YIG superfamily endonuclease